LFQIHLIFAKLQGLEAPARPGKVGPNGTLTCSPRLYANLSVKHLRLRWEDGVSVEYLSSMVWEGEDFGIQTIPRG